jgi:acyl transferase domain-containing protein
MMEPILQPFAKLVGTFRRQTPKIPFISNVTGTWIKGEEATDPGYWAQHLRRTVRFSDGLGELLQVRERVLLEAGPGRTLSGLAKQHPARNPKALALASLPGTQDDLPDSEAMLRALAQLWVRGATVDWGAFYAREQRRRVRLPTYPFERKRFWVEPARTIPSSWPLPKPSSNGSVSAKVGDKVENKVKDKGSEPWHLGQARSAPVTPSEQITAALRALLGELSGLEPAALDGATRFTELGFDSLFLTQASLVIEKRFGVQVAFRQLLAEFPTLNTLAVHIEEMIEERLVEEIDKLSDEEAQQLVHGVN